MFENWKTYLECKPLRCLNPAAKTSVRTGALRLLLGFAILCIFCDPPSRFFSHLEGLQPVSHVHVEAQLLRVIVAGPRRHRNSALDPRAARLAPGRSVVVPAHLAHADLGASKAQGSQCLAGGPQV